MALEVAVLDRLQAAEQQRRNLAELDHAAILLLRAVQRGDARRLEPRAGQRGAAVGVDQLAAAAAGQGERDAPLALAPVEVDEAAPRDRPARAVAVERPRHARHGVVDVARRVQLQLQRIGAHRQPRGELQRPRVDAAGVLPGQVVEAAAHLAVQIPRVRHQESDRQAQADPERNPQHTPGRAQHVQKTRGEERRLIRCDGRLGGRSGWKEAIDGPDRGARSVAAPHRRWRDGGFAPERPDRR